MLTSAIECLLHICNCVRFTYILMNAIIFFDLNTVTNNVMNYYFSNVKDEN